MHIVIVVTSDFICDIYITIIHTCACLVLYMYVCMHVCMDALTYICNICMHLCMKEEIWTPSKNIHECYIKIHRHEHYV